MPHPKPLRQITLALLLAAASLLTAQDRANAAGKHEHLGPVVPGYLPKAALDYHQLIPAPPAIGSPTDAADMATVRQWQQPEGAPRLALARADAEMNFSRFSEAFGAPISPAASPILVHLLDRVESDADQVLDNAKQVYARPRPFQRVQFEHVCGYATPPAPENSAKGSSYPSGHTTFGWTAVLTLALVDPSRAQALLARGREYAESRLVCAVHFPTDLQAAMILSSATVARVTAQPEFQRELACAAQEHQIALGQPQKLDSTCQTLANTLKQPAQSTK